MSFITLKRLGLFILPSIMFLMALCLFPGCGGGSSGDDLDEIIDAFNGRSLDLYREAPPVYVTGNKTAGGIRRQFYPKGDIKAGLCDTDGDGKLDTQINSFESFGNAANNDFREDIAACQSHDTSQRDHYDDAKIWLNDKANWPDTMPEYADAAGTPSTDATQWFQVIFPFEIDRDSVFDLLNVTNNFLKGEITLTDEAGAAVYCSVFLNGRDANGTFYDPTDPLSNWPDGAIQSTKTLVFIANTQTIPAIKPGIPDPTGGNEVAFTGTDAISGQWNNKEMYLRIGTISSRKGTEVTIDSKHLLRRSGLLIDDDDACVKVTEIIPNEYVLHPITGQNLQDQWKDSTGLPLNSDVVPTDVKFQVIFNKPVVPETVGRSIVFNKAPFTGNMKPIPNPQASEWTPSSDCGANPPPIQPICTNIAVRAFFLDTDGNSRNVQTPIPIRVTPLSQNNLAKYIINPIISLPGSSTDWSGDNIPGESAEAPTGSIRMRIEVAVHEFTKNTLTGGILNGTPQNLCPAGFHGERFFNSGTSYTKTFSVLLGERYVNAPVAPNVIYYTMGTSGVGAIDLNGSGFNTNTPGSGPNMWITATSVYSPYGNGMLNPSVSNGFRFPVGVGDDTPIPGLNEGSSGWFRDLDPSKDALVRDSYGSGQLYPDPSSTTTVNINDIEVGEFLDTIYFDRSNPYATDQLHLDLIYVAAAGNFLNNMISSPPTPNPPPLTVPLGMRPVDVILDDYQILQQGAFVIMGKEVFPPDLTPFLLTGPRQWVHLDPAGLSGGADKPFPPNAPGLGPWALGTYLHDGPLAESCTFGMGYSYASRQQIGNFLFAVDKRDNEVKVLNSNTMGLITTINYGISGPDQVAVTPDLKTLYVTNWASRSVSVYNVNPRSPEFLYMRATIPVGGQPKGICVQPDYEDVLVCNYGSNTMSIINPATNSVRKTVTALLKKPWDVVAAPRQTAFGWGTGVYHAYITNHGADNVLIFESGPDGLGGIGYDDILDPVPSQGESGQEFLEILNPRGLCFNPLYLHDITGATNLTGGVFVAHSSSEGAAVSRVMFVDQYGTWGPIPITPISGSIGGTPGFGSRAFLISAQWTAQGGFLSGFQEASDVALPDINREAWLLQNFSGNSYVTNWGAVGNNPSLSLPNNNKHPIRNLPGPLPTYYPDLLFVSYKTTKTIDVLHIFTGEVDTITGLPAAAQRLKTYFKN